MVNTRQGRSHPGKLAGANVLADVAPPGGQTGEPNEQARPTACGCAGDTPLEGLADRPLTGLMSVAAIVAAMGQQPATAYDSAIPDHAVALSRVPAEQSADRPATGRPAPPTATYRDTVAALLEIGLPMTAKGPLIRRRPVVALAERLDLDGQATRRMQRLARKYAPGPLLLRLPLRRMALLLEPADVHRVLHGEPEPFAVSTAEKRVGLAHFEPDNSLVSEGLERADRRRFSEVVLDMERPAHRLAGRFIDVLDEEAADLITRGTATGRLDWYDFSDAWFRMVRRVVLGDGAADDEELRSTLDSLRHFANMSFLAPRRVQRREQFHRRLADYLERAEPGSLASLATDAPVTQRTAPTNQVSQWLFAFDPAAMATYRTLALLATHPAQQQVALDEADAHPGEARTELRYLRACVLESLRLWPTTPLILRETTAETAWGSGTIPADTTLIIFAPFFHRDDRRLPYAHHFEPEVFLDEQRPGGPLVPFSGGPGICPGQNLVLLLSSAMLATLLGRLDFRMQDAQRLDPARPLPSILDQYTVSFSVSTRG
jgi:cytochrome P450